MTVNKLRGNTMTVNQQKQNHKNVTVREKAYSTLPTDAADFSTSVLKTENELAKFLMKRMCYSQDLHCLLTKWNIIIPGSRHSNKWLTNWL